MPGNYYHRYAGLSHQQLYNELMAGKDKQIDGIAAEWRAMQRTLDGLASSLNRSLDQLADVWSSSSGTEYRNRLSTIAGYSAKLSDEFDLVSEGLTTMASQLRQAQSKAESPAETDDHDKMVRDAAAGAAIGSVAGPVGTVVGGAVGALFGHHQDEVEKEKARQRMIQVVATLASDYESSSFTSWPSEPTPPPQGLPGGSSGGSANPAGGPAVGAPGAAPGTGTNTGRTNHTIAGPGHVGAPPSGGVSDPTHQPVTTTPGTALLGAGGILIGAAAVDAAAIGAVRDRTNVRGVGTAEGEFGSRNLVTEAAGGATAPTGPGLRSGVIGGDRNGRGLAGRQGRGLVEEEERGGANGRGSGANGRGRPGEKAVSRTGRGGSGRAGEHEEETDERLTWLTEDDMVWGGDERVSPPVLGTTAAPES